MTPSVTLPVCRVLMTADTVGGVWTYAVELCAGLVAHGTQVMLATMGAPVQAHQRAELVRFGDAVLLRESTFRLEWMSDPWDDVTAAGEWLLQLEREFQPDLVHLNGYAHAALSWGVPTLVVAHSCVFSWWRAVKNCAPPPSWAPYHDAVSRGLAHADLVVAPSRAMLATINRNYGAPRSARVIYNGRTLPFTAHYTEQPGGASAEQAGSSRGATHPLDAKKQGFVLSVGRLWDEAKNTAALAAIAPKLPWPVRVAGDSHAPDGGEINLRNVECLGRRVPAQLAEDYRRAAIYALPARYEPFGLSVLEAAHAGCALVLGDIPSLRELWTGTAVFVPPNDHDALRSELIDLIHNPHRRQALGLLATRRAAHFSADRMTSGYLSAYAELLSPAWRRAGVLTASFA